MRLYEALLRLLPVSFRTEYGGEMAAVFAAQLREARGVAGRFALWASAVRDVVWSAAKVHGDLLGQDVAYALRGFQRSPGFTVTAILVSSVGVGATTAAFSITDHVLVRSLPFVEPERLVKLWEDQTAGGYSRMEVSPPNYRDWKAMSGSFEAMGAVHPFAVNVTGAGAAVRLEGSAVTSDVLPSLGVPALLGRVFSAADDEAGAPGTLLLSYGLWQARFGGDPGVLGRQLVLEGEPYTIIGVMPPRFGFPGRATPFWAAARFGPDDFEERDNNWLQVVARLRPGVSIGEARGEMAVVAERLAKRYPKTNEKAGVAVVSLRDEVSPQQRLLLVALTAAAVCVLLIACANLMNLLLARAMVRRRELSVRSALGAGRERLVRQLLTESLLLAGVGGALGVSLAVAALPILARLVPTGLPIAETPALDSRMLALAMLVTTVTGLGFGTLPAVRALGSPAADGLREGSRSGVGGRRERLRAALVVGEVAASVVLLVSAGLLIRTLWRLQATDPGFRSEGALTLRTALPTAKYERAVRRGEFYDRVLTGVRALPGVRSAAYSSFLPMAMRGGVWPVLAAGQSQDVPEGTRASLRFVTPGFFETMGIPLRTGRDVSPADVDGAPSVAVVSQSLADRYWPGEDPIGRHFTIAFRDRTVVGVVGNVRVRGMERSSEPQVYLPHLQVADGSLVFYYPKDLVVRTSSSPDLLLPAIRRIVASADPEQPISDARMLSEIVEADTAPRAVQAWVLGAFAAVAALLAAIGIHGLLAFTVSSRAQEFGVRVALGATSRNILGLVLREGALLAGVGGVLGLALAYASGRAMEALLVGISPRDGAVFLAAATLTMFLTLAGTLVPAARAIRIDPVEMIRAE
jgi:putative ABC transport system permease protein